MTQILGLASGVFAFLDTNMLVSFVLGDAKVWRWGSKPTPVPNAIGFASQWNIGFSGRMALSAWRIFCQYVYLTNVII